MKENISDEFIKDSIDKNLLKRNKKLVNTINLIMKQKENFIMSINGEWGCGKTVFAKQIEYLLNNNELYRTVCSKNMTIPDDKIAEQEVYYYNAWENDAINMPVQSLIFQLIRHFNTKYENELNLKEVGKSVLDVFVKIGTMGLIGMDDISNNKFKQVDYEQLMSDISNIEDLKKCLNNVIDQILIENKNRLIIIIDELDRCRPTYAIEMLECIKHFYNNDKVSFLVVTNNAQLAKTVRKIYGNEYNGDLYLQRFYDVIINLSYDTSTKIKYASFIIGRDLEQVHIRNEIIMTCINYFQLELREINKFIDSVKIAERMLVSDNDTPLVKCERNIAFYLSCIAFAFNTINPQAYNYYISGNWAKIDSFIANNIRLLEWFENFEYFKQGVNENRDGKQLLKEIYIGVFRGINNTSKDNFISKLLYSSSIKYDIQSILELQ